MVTAQGRDLRIGVIGAGASGIATAHALREQGFAQVVVLEGEAELGGKCSTFSHQGRSFELGAAVLTPAYRETRRLAKQVGLTPTRATGASYVNLGSGRLRLRRYFPPTLDLAGACTLPLQTARVAASGLLSQRWSFPRLDRAPSEWSEPFESWCLRQGMRGVLEMMRPWATAFGYGYLDQTPTAYMLNYMCLLGPTYELRQGGYRELWKRVAQGLDVRVKSRVLKVERGASVRVETSGAVHAFDRIVIACPLEEAREFLDLSAEERELFAQVRYVDYQVVAAEVSGLPRDRYVFVPDHFGRDAADKPMFYYRRYPDHDLITFYSMRGAGGLPAAEQEIARLVERMGGRVRTVIARRPWRYFPHAPSQSLAAGFLRRLEALQGQRSTFYASEALSFSCVEPVVAFARGLVRRKLAVG